MIGLKLLTSIFCLMLKVAANLKSLDTWSISQKDSKTVQPKLLFCPAGSAAEGIDKKKTANMTVGL